MDSADHADDRADQFSDATGPVPAPSGAPTVPSGWYDDPHGQPLHRYWDGHSWTEHTAPKVAPGRFCSSCGKPIQPNAVVCLDCGAAASAVVPTWVAPRSPEKKSYGMALFLTILWPGAGHLYLGNNDKAMPYVIANAVGLVSYLFCFVIGIAIWLVTLLMLAPGLSAEVREVNA